MRAPAILCAIALLSAVACGNDFSDPPYLTGLSVLGIKAEPPDVPVGATSTLTALAIDTAGAAIELSWAECLDPPDQGDAINPACISNSNADFLLPEGNGLSITTTMPSISPSSLGLPDNSGGVYVPHIVHVVAGGDSLVASYLLRRNLGAPPNQNPVLTDLFQVAGTPDGALIAIDDASPLVVHAGDRLTLRAAFQEGSAESYSIIDNHSSSSTPRTVTERLRASWFATSGSFESVDTGADVPDVIFNLDAKRSDDSLNLPASGGTIDLWVVGRDERGGTDFLHRTLSFE